MKIWLDDQIRPSFSMHGIQDPEDWVCVDNVAEVIASLDAGEVTALHLDYDLSQSDHEHTGMDVLDHILRQLKLHNTLPPTTIKVHSMDYRKCELMLDKIQEIKQHVHALRMQRKLKKCPGCHGTGWRDQYPPGYCADCGGLGCVNGGENV